MQFNAGLVVSKRTFLFQFHSGIVFSLLETKRKKTLNCGGTIGFAGPILVGTPGARLVDETYDR